MQVWKVFIQQVFLKTMYLSEKYWKGCGKELLESQTHEFNIAAQQKDSRVRVRKIEMGGQRISICDLSSTQYIL